MDPIKYTPARNYTKANREPNAITLVVIHTAECAEVASAAENLATWGGGPNASQASWHYAVDADSITQSVREEDVAWHAGPVNGYSIGVEHAGRAAQTAEQWADAFSIATLERSAELVADICHRHDIPVERLGAADLAAGRRRGLCGHVDVTNGLTGGRGHTDPGTAFPWEWYLERVESRLAGLRAAEAPPQASVRPVADDGSWVYVSHGLATYLVCPIYVPFVSIGEAEDLAARLGCELPSPALVDAIWLAADLRIDGRAMVRSDHDGTMRTMASAEMFRTQEERLARQIGARALGRDFRLLAGAFKDVVREGGKVGLYGWHGAYGTPIQPFYSGHVRTWRDYSQGLRLVKLAR